MSDNWRSKYLDSLEQQESLEQQADLLRQSVLRLCLAANGQDAELDEQLDTLRRTLRKGYDRPAEVRLIQLEDQLRAFEQRRGQFAERVRLHLAELSAQLSDGCADKAITNKLKNFERQLHKRSAQVSGYPQLLQELALLQREALQQAATNSTQAADGADSEAENSGLLSRLFKKSGKGEAPGAEPESEPPLDQPFVSAEPGRESVQRMEAITDAALEAAGEQAEAAHHYGLFDEQGEPIASREPPFSQVSERITRILLELLNQIEPEECILDRVADARRRIKAGLNWFELVPTLEDIRDLMMQAYLAADRQFVSYLEGISAELEDIFGLLGSSLKREQNLKVASDKLKGDVEGQVILAEEVLRDSSDIDQLKRQLEAQLSGIRAAMTRFEQAEAEASLSDQLRQLMNKVEHLEAEASANRQQLEQERQKALHDALTKLPNREAWNERSYHEYQRWQRYQRPLVVAVFDIDHFKRINDTYGHQAGDRVLAVIAKGIKKRLREVDFFARYGGEEFAALLPETELASATKVLDGIRAAIAKTGFKFKEQPLRVTLSVGLTEFKSGDTVESAFERADQALYRAKANGRNQCEQG